MFNHIKQNKDRCINCNCQTWATRKIHDLFALVLECEKYDATFEQLEPIIEGIIDFAVEFRYPDYRAISEEANDALENTEKSRAFIMNKL